MKLQRRYLGTGFGFPLRVAPSGGFELSRGERAVEQSIWLILATAPGERQMRPEFGCGVHDLVFAPNGPATRVEIQSAVREALTRWEPRIDVVDVRVEAEPGRREVLLIHIDYRIRSNNALGNLVYPFFLREGEGL